MKWVISRYNHDVSYIADYPKDEFVIYDRSETPLPGTIVVPNIGSDIYDKFSYIIENYDQLPDVALYTKANIFKFITQSEFNEIKYNKTFTPVLTKFHKTYLPTCFYSDDGMYNEINNYWYLAAHPPKSQEAFLELLSLLNNYGQYAKFAPGSTYILPKENILKHPKEFYMKLRSFLEYDRYPGEAMIIERALYHLWQ